MELPPDLLSWLARNFPQRDLAEATACLAAAVDHTGAAAHTRLLRCAAWASRGEPDRLRYYVELMRIDYRDVIVAGEYEVMDNKLVHTRDGNEAMTA